MMQKIMIPNETIRLSALTGKNVVNIYDGVRLGTIYEPVVAFDESTGRLEQLYLGGRNGITGNWSEKNIVPPITIGHEYIGEIAELGEGVTGFKVGQKVSGEGHLVCGHCYNCF